MQDKENTQMDESNEKDPLTDITDNTAEKSNEAAEKTTNLETKVTELNDKYLRLYSEFDNYRKRTNKERADVIKTASEDVLKAVLPVVDDMERALKASEGVLESAAIKEGLQLILNKLKNILHQKGLTALESIDQTFNPDTMEAITHVPATDDAQKGKIIDEIEKGYKLGDKVIRFAKVVVAQ